MCNKSSLKHLGEWTLLAESETVKSADLHERLSQYWTLMATIAGLLAGFSYVIANTSIQFVNDHAAWRRDVFGGLIIMTFLTALTGTLMSALLFGYLNVIGKENAKWFVLEWWLLVDVPLVFVNLTVFLMLITSLIAIGGLYSDWVWYLALFVGIMGIILFFVCFILIKNSVRDKLKQK